VAGIAVADVDLIAVEDHPGDARQGPHVGEAEADDERRDGLRRDWVAYFDQYRNGSGVVQPRPYVLVLGSRR
jgi:hypothetical protein